MVWPEFCQCFVSQFVLLWTSVLCILEICWRDVDAMSKRRWSVEAYARFWLTVTRQTKREQVI